MHLSLPFFSALIVTATAASIPYRRSPTSWTGWNLTTGCSPAGCTYNFNIAGAPSIDVPGFNTTCSGTDLQAPYKPCADSSVKTTVRSNGWPLFNITILHEYMDDHGVLTKAYGNQTNSPVGKIFTVPIYRLTE